LHLLQAAGDITYSIVRPTAFFKSLAGQIELVKQGKPYVMFGDGNLASCKPISEQDLARFMADCVVGEYGCCANAFHTYLTGTSISHNQCKYTQLYMYCHGDLTRCTAVLLYGLSVAKLSPPTTQPQAWAVGS
jgi:hypothetical protein